MCERDIPSPVWRKGWAVRAAHKKKNNQHYTHSLFTKRQTKGNKVPGDECLRTDKERGSGDECLRTDKEGRQLLVRTSVALLTKLVSSFQPGYWCLILHTHRERHSRVPVSTKGKYNMINCQDEAKSIHVKCPMPYKSNIRVVPLLVEEGVSTILFLLFCVNIFCFLFSFWYAQTRAPFFYCLFAFVLIFYCFFCL